MISLMVACIHSLTVGNTLKLAKGFAAGCGFVICFFFGLADWLDDGNIPGNASAAILRAFCNLTQFSNRFCLEKYQFPLAFSLPLLYILKQPHLPKSF